MPLQIVQHPLWDWKMEFYEYQGWQSHVQSEKSVKIRHLFWGRESTLSKPVTLSVFWLQIWSTFHFVGLPRNSSSEQCLLESSFLLSPKPTLWPYLISAPWRVLNPSWDGTWNHRCPSYLSETPWTPGTPRFKLKNSNCICQEVSGWFLIWEFKPLGFFSSLWAELPGILKLLEISDIVSFGPVFRSLWSKSVKIQETVVIYFLKQLQWL